MLKEILNEDLVLVNYEANSSIDAIKMGGDLLLKNGFIEARYIDAMLKNIKENGPYIVLAPGVAIPHARVEDGAIGIGFSVITLSEPIKFGHKINDPVKLVITLSAVDQESHIQALSELADVLSNEQKLSNIYNAKSKKELLENF